MDNSNVLPLFAAADVPEKLEHENVYVAEKAHAKLEHMKNHNGMKKRVVKAVRVAAEEAIEKEWKFFCAAVGINPNTDPGSLP